MAVRQIARQLTPPIVKNLLRRYRSNGTEMPRFVSYNEAIAYCANVGYENDRLIEAIHWSTKHLRDRLAGASPLDVDDKGVKNLMVLERCVRNGELHVIDFGGACGMHYFWARAYFGDRVRIRWHVVETAAMVKQCADLKSDELFFHESMEDARIACPEPDLTYTSGAIVYTPAPLDFTRMLVESNARFLYFTRQGLLEDNRTVVTIQERKISKGVRPLPPGMEDSIVRYPVTWVPRASFESLIQERYQIELRVKEEEMLFKLDGTEYQANGYLASRKGESRLQ